jgi:hypothetical protein
LFHENPLRPGTPVPLRRSLSGHVIDTAFELGWSNLQNGDLLEAAERDGYEVLITTDQSLRYQQNLVPRRISILVLMSTDWRRIQLQIDAILTALNSLSVGSYLEVSI